MSSIASIATAPFNGFDAINRYWDPENQIVTAKLLPGEYYVTNHDEMITTILGSCVAACIRDRVNGIGGMNHFMLPETHPERLHNTEEKVIGLATRYGNYAMEHLINTILRNGGERKNLEIKLFGGAKVIPTLSDIGAKNIEFVLEYVHVENLKLLAHDLGNSYARKINYFPSTGKVRMKKIRDMHNETLIIREKQYHSSLKQVTVESSIELF